MDKNKDFQQRQKEYNAFIRLYKGREDVIAEQKEDGKYISIKGEGLTFERFLEHIYLQKTYAIYNMDDKGRVHFGLFDMDVIPRNQEWTCLLSGIEEKKNETVQVIKILMEMGLERKHFLLEFPTVGFHLWIFFKSPINAKKSKKLMELVLRRARVSGISFYPKNISMGSWGDRIQLPLRINRNTLRRSIFIRDLDTFDPENYDSNPNFTILEDVEWVPNEWVDQWTS